MSDIRRRLTLIGAGLAAFAAAVSLTACSSSTAHSSSTSTTSGGGGSNTVPAAYQTAFTGTVGKAPTAAVKPARHALAWVVSCGEQVPTCGGPAGAAVAAAKTAGWDAKLCDGKLNPAGWAGCIRQGITAKASGIITIGVDCDTVQGALQEANSASLPTIAAGGNDCDVTGGKNLYTAVVKPLADLSIRQWWEKMGALQADWLIGKTRGSAQVLSLQFTDGSFGAWIQDGFTTELATCSGCKIVSTLKVGNADVGSGQLPQKFGTALLKVPTANAVNVPLDGWFFAGLSQAIASSGRSSQLAVIGAFGEPGNLDLIAKGTGEDATVAFNPEWIGWAGVDTLARVLAKQPAQPAGVGLQTVDADHNMPAAGTAFQYSPAVDYQSTYQKDWGVG